MKAIRKPPLPESYWVIPGRFLAGEYPGRYEEELTRKRIDSLLEAGIDLFIDLTGPNEVVPYSGILREQAAVYEIDAQYRRFSIRDFGLPTPEQMNTILHAIDQGLQAGRNIYLHCQGGIGRTGTTVGCYLVRTGKNGEEALQQLSGWWREVPKSSLHPRSPETPQQVDFVLHWAASDDLLQGKM
jgi:hypothetical protein